MTENRFDQFLKVDMKNLMSEKFQYGMTLEGVLEPRAAGHTAVYIINPDHITLIYKCQTDNFSDYIKQRIFLNWASREYGNKKARFICPECGSKTMVLYNSGISFMCLKCTVEYEFEGLTDNEQTARIHYKLKNGTIMNTVWI